MGYVRVSLADGGGRGAFTKLAAQFPGRSGQQVLPSGACHELLAAACAGKTQESLSKGLDRPKKTAEATSRSLKLSNSLRGRQQGGGHERRPGKWRFKPGPPASA